jgi:uncharacterized protein YbjT (DUF2867 family)
MTTPPIQTLWLAGATGLVGRQLLLQALAEPGLQRLHTLGRRAPPGVNDPRLQAQAVDFAALPALPPAGPQAAAVCALGTTIRVAGSQAAFRAVDHDAVLAFARAVRGAGVQRFGLVSALGADPAASVFYNRVKGEVEAALQTLGFASLVIVRPSLLLGDRTALGQPERLGERLGQVLSRPLGALLPARWRPIEAAVVARALWRAMQAGRPGVQFIESGDLQQQGRP